MILRKRDVLIFLAGAEAFHTLAHIALGLSGALPLQILAFELTPRLNLAAVLMNALITGLLLWWVTKLKKIVA